MPTESTPIPLQQMYVAWPQSPYVELEEAVEGQPEKFRRIFVGGFRGSVSEIYDRIGNFPQEEPPPFILLPRKYWHLQTRKERILDALKAGKDPTKLAFNDTWHNLDNFGEGWMEGENFKRNCFEETTEEMIELEEIMKKDPHAKGKGTYWELPDTTPIPGWWGPEAKETIRERDRREKKALNQSDPTYEVPMRKVGLGSRGSTNPKTKQKIRDKSDKKKARRANDRQIANQIRAQSVVDVEIAVQERLREMREQGLPIIERPTSKTTPTPTKLVTESAPLRAAPAPRFTTTSHSGSPAPRLATASRRTTPPPPSSTQEVPNTQPSLRAGQPQRTAPPTWTSASRRPSTPNTTGRDAGTSSQPPHSKK